MKWGCYGRRPPSRTARPARGSTSAWEPRYLLTPAASYQPFLHPTVRQALSLSFQSQPSTYGSSPPNPLPNPQVILLKNLDLYSQRKLVNGSTGELVGWATTEQVMQAILWVAGRLNSVWEATWVQAYINLLEKWLGVHQHEVPVVRRASRPLPL